MDFSGTRERRRTDVNGETGGKVKNFHGSRKGGVSETYKRNGLCEKREETPTG